MQTKPAACGKRLLALVLAIVMVCSLLPVSAFAAEPDYELRVLTFEDADYKGGTNFAGGNNWTSLIDSPQYGGKMLYGESGAGVDSVDAAYKWTDKNNTWLSNTLSEGYGSWCYWSGGHAVSNYVSGEISKYGGFESQLTVYKKDVSGLERTGGGHNGSNNFAVHYGYADNSGYGLTEASLPTLTFADGTARVIDHMYVNNTDYALNCYIDGNGLTAKIGDDDWVKLVATGYNAAGEKTGTASIYLCNGPKNIMMDWTKWDLSGLGKVLKVTFNVTGSSDNGYGFSQPAYFAYDDVAVRFEKAAAVVPATGVTLDKTTLNLMTGETAVLTAAAQPENTTDTLTWTTGNEAVATVADGVVTAVGAGSTVITAACGSVKAECAVTVTASPLTVSVGGKACALTRVGGEDGTKYRAALPYGSDVTIHVADASFLLVTDKKSNYLNDAGVNPFTLTAAELETTLLTDKDEKPFTPAENSKVAYLSIMDAMAGTTYELYLELTREVTPATGVTLDQTELTLTAGKTASLKATVQPENTTDTIVWSSSKEEVATVENGIVTAKAAGETVITATCGTVKAECAVTVTPPVMASAVTLDKTELNLYTGDTAALTAAIQPEDTTDPTIAWTTTDAEVASVQNGVVTAGKTGTATITASCGEAKAQCAVTVKAPAEPAQKDGVYQIGNADELVWFVKKVNGGENAISAVLAKDIDLANVLWVPIGNGSVAFAGSFDGAGHTVSNLTVDYTTATSGERLYLGLFGQVEGTPEKHAVIQNLTVTGSVNAASEFSVYSGYVAGVVGSARYAELSNVISRVNVTADEKVGNAASVGGLAGAMIDTTVTNCGNEGNITGVKNLGGLCYELYSGTMTGCYNTGRVTATGTYVGGLMGYAKQATVTNVYNTGDVSTEKTLVGGLIGVMEKSALTNAYTTGKVTTAAASGAIGAAVGSADQVSNVYYLGGASAIGDENATAKTAEELKALAPTLGSSFKENSGCGGYPLLVWQEARAHQYEDGVCTVCGAKDPAAPYLLDGVTDAAAEVQTGKSYQLDDLMDGKIFGVKNGTLTYKNYFYTMSSDGGATWSGEQHFEEAMFGGVNKSLVQSKAGTYIYKFRAKNDAGYSADTWTLTLTFVDVVEANINFYVGRDQNYSTNGNKYPILKMYKTAGIDENQFDYVGWFTDAEGKTVYVYNPADYTIIDGEEKDYVEIDGTKYELHDYEEVRFTNSAFDAADETATASNTVVNNYNMFYATLSTGRYSTRGYGWNTATEAYDIYLGGQSLPLPMEKDIYGGGGNDIHLGVVSVYATTRNEKNEYFGTDDYHVEMIMPVTGSMIHSGTHYTYTRYGSDYTAFPFLSWEAQNASLYNIYAYPTNTEKYMFNQQINQTTAPSYNVVTKNITIANAVELDITAPTTAEFTLFFQYNNFNTRAVEPYKTAKDDATGMTTYSYRVSERNNNYTWRLVDETGTYVTKAGWLSSLNQKTEKTITFDSGAPTDRKSHSFKDLGTTVSSRDEADLQVFLSHSGFMSVSDTYRIRAYRMWELINNDAGNIMVEPSFNIQVLQGNAADVKQVNGGNAEGNWIDVKPTGTDIVAVTYDAIDMYSNKDVAGTHGGFFPANNPERTGVFVITNEAAGTADATVTFNGGTISSRGANWDYNYDTWYYLNTDTAPTLDFTVKAAEGVKVSYAVVTTNASLNSTLSDWSDLTAGADGKYHADLLPFRTAGTLGGTVIIKMVDSTGTSYRLVRVAQTSVTVKNASNSGEPIMPGDKVTLSFDGLYRGVDKVSGIFNPLTLNLNYSTDEDDSMGSLGQYQQMDRASVTVEMPTDITFPEGSDKTTVMVTDGYISGGMYSAPSPFDTLYNMTDTGVGTNFSAVNISFVASRLADIPVEVNRKVYYSVKLVAVDENGNVFEDLTPTLKDGDNKLLTAEADGTYKLGYGSYTYAIEQLGYVRTSGSFKLGSADAEKVENGVITVKFTVRKAAENAWDGKTATEPKTGENGVYLIGTGAELAWFAQKVNGGSTKISGILTADIDLAGYEWTPIGTASKQFAGTFDGQNHTVDNLSINYSSTTPIPLYRGLFGWVSGANVTDRAKIENMTVNGTVVASSTKSVNDAYVGGIAGRADYADLTNLHANVDVSIKRTSGNYQSVGGVVGGTYYSLNVTNCSNSGNVTGWRYCAGIVGNISSGNQPSTITGCVNTGSITAPSTCAAGIVSNLPNGCKVTACYNTGTIKAGGNYPAGIVGYCANSEVRSCFNLGTVTCNTTFTYGSVIGTVSSADAVIKNLYYLEGTCEKGGIGAVKNAETQTAAVRTAEEIANAEFVSTMNADLAEAAFTSGCTATKHPILLWQVDAEHTFANTASDVIKSEATCTEAAVYYVKCDNCDAVSNTLTVKVGEPLGHDLTVTVVEPTCEKDGYTESVCARCGLSYRTNYVAAKGHSYVDVVTAPTCESAGYTTHTCSVCGDSYVDAMLPATGHSYVDVVTAPTCESAGYTTHTCSVCGSSYVDTMIDALGHDYQTVVTAPTCDAMGYTTHTCTRCGNSYVDSYTQAADHSYTSEVTKQPTCTEEGVRTFTCTNCSKSYTESIPMIAHSYEEVKTEPDCTHMGYTTYTCSVCGDSYKADFVDAAGHDCEATVVAPTCEGYGYTENHCKHCDYTYISEIRQPLGHDDKLTGAKEATCTEPGYTGDMVCTRCGEVHNKGEEIPALGHDYGDWTTVKEADCFHTGLEERKCGRCGETEQRETTAETCPSEAYTDLDRNGWYHEYVDWVLKNGVMNGVGGGLFEPNGETTRAMLVMVLYRMAGAPDMAGRESSFTDVSADSWYGAAVIWASENGIVNGVGGGLFDPDASLTREQMAMMLYRFAGYLGSNTEKRADLSAYGDADAVSAFAQDAMAWAVAEGLVNGRSAAELAPKAGATRAELATILFRFAALQNA
ncbi:MAG: DUF4465 domain-containing protein [Oscillospiraceae bacterium]